MIIYENWIQFWMTFCKRDDHILTLRLIEFHIILCTPATYRIHKGMHLPIRIIAL